MPAGFNGTRQIMDIPAGGTLAVLATGPLRYLQVTESTRTSTGVANAPAGLNYTIPNDGSPAGFTTLFPVNPPSNGASDTPTKIELGDPMALHGPHGTMIGNGPGMLPGIGPTLATTLCKVSPATAAGTSVLVEQYY
jgi:hypothetical protein